MLAIDLIGERTQKFFMENLDEVATLAELMTPTKLRDTAEALSSTMAIECVSLSRDSNNVTHVRGFVAILIPTTPAFQERRQVHIVLSPERKYIRVI